jgi:hypothetical protein
VTVPPARKKKPCNCKNSRCLKLYCDCFASGVYCNGCNCRNCHNNKDHERARQKAVEATLERNPNAFRPKISSPAGASLGREAKHNKGCNCRKSSCLKKYCECFEAQIWCGSHCRCVDCKNYEGSYHLNVQRGQAAAAAAARDRGAVGRRAPSAAPPGGGGKRRRGSAAAGTAAASSGAARANGGDQLIAPSALKPLGQRLSGSGLRAQAGTSALPSAALLGPGAPPMPLPRSCLAGAINEEVVQDLMVLLASAGREAGQRFEAKRQALESAAANGAEPMDVDGALPASGGDKAPGGSTAAGRGGEASVLEGGPAPAPAAPASEPAGAGAAGATATSTAAADDLLCEEEEGTFDHDSPGRLGSALPPGRLTADQPSAKFAAQEGAVLAEFENYLQALLKIGREAQAAPPPPVAHAKAKLSGGGGGGAPMETNP